jgi:hypothetical protein
MKPKEKAIELVDKMGFSTSYTIDNTSGQSTPIYKNQYAKQCALIAVDEILNAITFNMYDEDAYNKEDKYWQDVKTEIEKL